MLLFIVCISTIWSIDAPAAFPGPCSVPPHGNGFKTVLFESGKGALVTCDENQGSYIKTPGPDDNSYGKKHFASYVCKYDSWFDVDSEYSSKRLMCMQGCPHLPRSDFLHAFSEEGDCTLLNEKDSTAPPSYETCIFKCMPGYFSNAKAKNHMSSSKMYCKELYGKPYWPIKDGYDLEPFVHCTEGLKLNLL
ncbi:hypothetical protein MHBO_003974 [Bonamia ostreae]|uniref:Secreted protein n=1 Tax=Bonamia ostreae TaxID=126728 RepID=A0ABV2AS04_9EUKA